MRTTLWGLVLATVALTGCGTPRPTGGYHYSLLMAVAARSPFATAEPGNPPTLMHLDARVLRSTGEVQVSADDLQPAGPNLPPLAVAMSRNQVGTVAAPSTTLAIGKEWNCAISSDRVPPVFSLVDTRDGSWAVARIHDEVIQLRAIVKDYDAAAHTGHVSFEMALQSHGKIGAYFKADDHEFRDGEPISFEPTSPEWPQEAHGAANGAADGNGV